MAHWNRPDIRWRLLLDWWPAGQIVEHRLQIFRQRRDEFQPPLVARVVELQSCRMKERTLEALHRADVASHASVDATVHRIADDRMADGAQVHANLMRAAGVNRDLAQREA